MLSSLKAGTVTVTATVGTTSGFMTVTVSAPILTKMSVDAPSSSLAAGDTLQLTATATYSDQSTQNVTSSSTWQTSNAAVATVNSSGMLSALKSGTVTVTATAGTTSGSVTITVSTATLSSILVAPASASLFAGQTTQMKATGVYSDGSSQDVTAQVSWTSNNPLFATVNASGLVTAVAKGQVTITATSGAISGTSSIGVNAVVLASIAVTPANVSIAAGQTQQFVANGIFSDGSTTDITKNVVWDTDKHTVATMTQGGVATGVATGTANVTATSGGIVGSVAMSVTAALLQSVDIFPDGPTISVGGQVQLSVTGTFSDNTTATLTNATYSSSDPTIATVDPVTGVVTGVSANANGVTITATVGTLTDTDLVTVIPATLQSVTITPSSASITNGTTQQFALSGIFSDGTIQPLLQGVTWTSSVPATAGVDVNGIATAVAVGQTTIQAEYAGFSATATLVVTPAVLTSITVTPALPTIGVGGSQQFTATGGFNDGTTQDLTSLVQWSSSNSTAVLINNAGLASALTTGTTEITAQYQGFSGSASLTVSVVKLSSITVLPATPVVPTRTKIQFTAMGVFSDGSSVPLTGVSWSFSWGKIGRINSQGLAQTKKSGSAKVTATLNGISGYTTLTVTTSSLASVKVSPVTPTIASGTTQQFTLTGTFGNGTTVDLSSSAYWQTSNYKEAVINSAGLASGLTTGQVTITATYKGLTDQTTLAISSASIASIAVTPSAPTVVLGSMEPFTATATFSDGTSQDVTLLSQWTSSNPLVAVVNKTGVASTASQGSTNINATFKTHTGTADLTVK